MALSGSFGQDVGSHWRLQVEWSATQNVSENKSNVTVKLYWMATSGYGAVNSSASKTAGLKVNGGSWNEVTKSNLASLSGNQKKLIHSDTWTVAHDSDGGKSFSIEAYFDAEINLSGTYYGRIRPDARTYSLNTIPRESTLNDTTPTWVAGSDTTFSIKRYSSSFKHEVEIYVENPSGGSTGTDGRKYTHLKQLVYSTSQTSQSTAFNTAEKYEAFQRLAGDGSKRIWVRLQTFSGSTTIGGKEYYGTVTAPNASKPTVNAFTLGNTVNIAISRSDGEFKHEVKASIGSWSKVLDSDAGTSYSWNTSTDMSSILGQLGSSASGNVTITVSTYYFNGSSKQIVRTPQTVTVKCTVPNTQAPTFTGAVTWTDSNATLNTLKGTGNNAIMIQGKSTLVVTLPSTALATPKAGTTMKNYSVTINGITKTVNHPSTASNLTFTFSSSEINVGTNQTMKVRALDNRGLSTTVNKTVVFVPYSTPSATMTAKRNDGFGEISTVGILGNISPLNVAGSNKNALTNVKYRVKVKGSADTTYTSLVTMTMATATFPAYRTENVDSLSLASEKAWTVQFQVTDKLGTYSYTKDIGAGIPIIAWDMNGSVGIGKYPQGYAPLEFGTSKWRKSSPISGKSSVGGAMDLANSDMVNANAIYFSDTSEGLGEGMIFQRSDFPTDGTDTLADNWDTWYVRDQVVYLNEKPIYFQNHTPLYTNNAGIVMNSTHSITPSRGIEACPNGWLLCWFRDNNSNYEYSYIPKNHVTIANDTSVKLPLIGVSSADHNNAVYKIVYISKTTIRGHTNNDSITDVSMLKLKHVLAW